MDPNHPKQKLLFFVAQNINDDIRSKVRNIVLSFTPIRHWLLGPPRFVDTRERPKEDAGRDLPIETLGMYLEIYSALPPLKLPHDIDLQHLDEVNTIVNALTDFSRAERLVFELELDGTFVGSITEGVMDRCLSEGLLGEWKRQLKVS